MSPKGGIKPHRRFSIQAKRSEVLFVDYMAEHLTPKGRAAIIVPEGIIFQGQGAYKELRKMLVENSLVAVVSLPAGCFNPYSGVKTSILILDKALAKKSDSVGFFKIENDGFGLGAQRRVIELNDLPQVQAELDSFLQALRNGRPVTDLQPISGLIVSKQIIAANGEYNLSGERYREGTAELGSFPYIPLADLCRKIQYGLSVPLNTDRNGFKTFRMNELVGGRCVDRGDMKCADISGDEFENYRLHRGDILFNRTNSFEHVGRTGIFDLDGDYCFASYLIRLSEFVENVDPFFINAMMNSESFRIGIKQFASRAIGQSNINATSLGNYTIPIPSLDLQKEIVAEIAGYQNVINGARTVLENYRPHIHIRPDWPIVELGELCSFKNGLNFDKASSGYSLKIIGVSDFQKNLYAPMDDLSEVHLDSPIGEDYLVRAGDILFVRSNGNPDLVGRSIIIPPPTQPTTFSGFSIRGRMKDDRAMPLFYAYFFKSRDFAEMIKTVGQGANIRNLSQGILNGLRVPLPPKEIQEAIIAEIESEQTLVYSNRELIARFEKKIQATLSRVWGEEESAPSGA